MSIFKKTYARRVIAVVFLTAVSLVVVGLFTPYSKTIADRLPCTVVSSAPISGQNGQIIGGFNCVTNTPAPSIIVPTSAPVTKPSLKTERQVQQSQPPPNSANGDDIGCERHKSCARDQLGVRCDTCTSPLYLYGPSGKVVDITAGTKISNTVPASNGTYHVTLAGGGTFHTNSGSFTSIAFDYVPTYDPPAPASGSIVAQKDVLLTLQWYARRLGLRENEEADLLSYAKTHLKADLTFISFFDETTSEKILPLSFTPWPDTYQNIVFYFQDLPEMPSITPMPPEFPKLQKRLGFTAIEVSEYHVK